MYSVLIQNQATMDLFRQVHPIFMEAIENQSLGVCPWMESGTTIDTAIPEIYALTEDKEEWRAIIVRMEDDGCMKEFASVRNNPYDFIANASSEVATRESEIPLVRLAQMLGGIPAPQMHFETEVIYEENRAPRMIYRPVVRAEDEAAYQALCEKYHFHGAPPSEILLVSLRRKQKTPEAEAISSWGEKNTIKENPFWSRNSYPSVCRFLVYDMEQQGEVQRTADYFRAWTAVLLLALNLIDSSTMQAYCLYRLDVEMDKEVMQRVFQSCIDRTLSARYIIQKNIRLEQERLMNPLDGLPDYTLEIPVIISQSARDAGLVETKAFKLTASSPQEEAARWGVLETASLNAIQNMVAQTARALDHSAERAQKCCYYLPENVHPLNEYQIDDFRCELDELYGQIFAMRKKLPAIEVSASEEMAEAARAVKVSLLKRVTARQAVGSFLAAIGLTTACFVPAVFLSGFCGIGFASAVPGILLTSCLLFGAAEAVVLFEQKRKLRDKIRAYNGVVHGKVTRILENSALFSKYMSSITSHMRGSSYLSVLDQKKYLRNEEKHHKENHISALNEFLLGLKKWSTAFYLSVNTESVAVNEDMMVDTETAPYRNSLYTFESQMRYEIPVNHSGTVVESPFSFVRRLYIVREEL